MTKQDAEIFLSAPDPRDRKRRLRSARRQLREQGLLYLARKIPHRVNGLYYTKRYDINIRRLYYRLDRVPIDRPIFLLGVQGGGGTVIARTLLRHPKVVYASGNCKFWAGGNEIHNRHHTIRDLPESLIHRSAHFFNTEGRLPTHPIYGLQRAWLYATDEFLPTYRRRAEDADEQTAVKLRRVIRKLILAYAIDPRFARFVDKSQLYTIQVGCFRRMLEDTDPRFILISRNPYVTCMRAVQKEYDNRGTRVRLTTEQKIQCAVQHWDNSFRHALGDGEKAKMIHVRYEDFLRDPEDIVRRMCEFVELDFHPLQVPAAGQGLPLGSVEPEKWYPLGKENRRYFETLLPELVEALNERSADLIERLGYESIA